MNCHNMFLSQGKGDLMMCYIHVVSKLNVSVIERRLLIQTSVVVVDGNQQ